MEEIWKSIPGYEGSYEVSNMGNVRSLDRIVLMKNGRSRFQKGRVLKTSGGKNYILVTIGVVNYAVHRLVACLFVPNPQNLPVVNHKDENRFNNRADNLEWCTQRYNTNYGTAREKRSKGYLHPTKCVEQRDIDGNLLNRYESVGEAARKTGLRPSNICGCCKKYNGHFTAGGFKWNYLTQNEIAQ